MMALRVVRDHKVPGRYVIVFDVIWLGDGQCEAAIMPWRLARAEIEPEAYAVLARASFEDWCQHNGYPKVTG